MTSYIGFEPTVFTGGLSGWNLIQKQYDVQYEAFKKNPTLENELSYFKEKIQNVKTVDDLVADRRLMTVALSAFSMEDNIDFNALNKKILSEEGYAEKFSDSRYEELSGFFDFASKKLSFTDNEISKISETFGLSKDSIKSLAEDITKNYDFETKLFDYEKGPELSEKYNISESVFYAIKDGLTNLTEKQVEERSKNLSLTDSEVDAISEMYIRQRFEESIGNSYNELRVSLYAERQLPKAESWFDVMGDQNVLSVVQKAFGLPEATGQLDVDRQKEIYEDKAFEMFGTKDPAEIFSDPDNLKKVIEKYLVMQDIEGGYDSTTPGAVALSLISSGASSFGYGNLFGGADANSLLG